ncbi:DDE-type integrase/transposase/recombinase [Paenibacillus sp. FSL R7-0272]|uniref:DDE-type integrase/transposase/recombinase n=1 Tax=Paenibacillus sp. FSL R7-0272 TaxID=2921679 RepID=UPI0030EBBF0E
MKHRHRTLYGSPTSPIFHAKEAWLSLASVLDLYTREIVGWILYNHMETSLALDALQAAYETKSPAPGLFHHSDRGSPCTSKEYMKQLQTYGMECSMSRRGNCYDNAFIESWHRILKKELIYCNTSVQGAKGSLYCHLPVH